MHVVGGAARKERPALDGPLSVLSKPTLSG